MSSKQAVGDPFVCTVKTTTVHAPSICAWSAGPRRLEQKDKSTSDPPCWRRRKVAGGEGEPEASKAGVRPKLKKWKAGMADVEQKAIRGNAGNLEQKN